MNAVARYLMTLVCGGILVSLVLAIGGNSGSGAHIRKMLCGMFMALIAISPLRSFDFSDLDNPWHDYSAMAQSASSSGISQATDTMISIISEQSEAYILDKAEALGVSVNVDIEVDRESFQPVFATITGRVTPYEKEMISGFLTEDLLIERSAQQWRN